MYADGRASACVCRRVCLGVCGRAYVRACRRRRMCAGVGVRARAVYAYGVWDVVKDI